MKFLFVDDEVRVLEGLERSMFMVADDDWELEFVTDGAVAIERLATGTFDAVVTDMRMPGVDGAEVLRSAQRLAPETARLVLSGQMESASAVEALERAHQILSKPCTAQTLCDALRSLTRYRPLLERGVFRRGVVAVDRLPAAPQIYRDVKHELDGGDPSIARLAAIAGRDTGLTARLMHVANSALFGNGRRLNTAVEAISRLGLDVFAALAAAAVFERNAVAATLLDLGALQARALATAEHAAQLWRPDPGLAFLAGILSDVGVLVVATTLPAEHDAAVAHARTTGQPQRLCEELLWGVTHAEIGAYLLGLWGMPAAVVDAVVHHHGAPSLLGGPADPGLAAAVAVAAAHAERETPSPADLARLGMTADEALRQCGGTP